MRKHTLYSNILISEDLDIAKSKKKDRNHFLMKIERILNHTISTVVIGIMTLIVLVGDDIRLIALPPSADIYVDTVIFLCFTVFTLELLFSCVAKSGYPFSFFFWLDCISLGSMVFDIYFIITLVISNNIGPSMPLHLSHVAHAGRASKVGAKAGRMIKLMRIIKIVRVAKFYNQTTYYIQRKVKNLWG